MLKLESSRYGVVLSVAHYTRKGVSTRLPGGRKMEYDSREFNPRGTTICRRHLSEADTHEQLLTYRLPMVGRRTADDSTSSGQLSQSQANRSS